MRPDDRIIVDPVAALLPGLADQFPQMEALQADSIRRALELHQAQLVQRGQALSFVTTLPCLEEKIVPQMEATAATAEKPRPNTPLAAPTHLLQGAVARPLGADR